MFRLESGKAIEIGEATKRFAMSIQFPESSSLLPDVIVVPSGCVHVWLVDLNRGKIDGQGEALEMLSNDERARMSRFRFERDRQSFLMARSSLRILLGRYTAQRPANVELLYGANGKPALARGEPYFNLAHSGNLAVIAISGEADVGIDIERFDRQVDADELIARFASANERDAYFEMPIEHRRTAFFHWWTRKESVLKALGTGLSSPIDSFDVSIVPGEARVIGSRLLQLQGAWSLFDLNPGSGFAASMAIPGGTWAIQTYRL